MCTLAWLWVTAFLPVCVHVCVRERASESVERVFGECGR